jgi:hypothetical protein
MGGIVSGVGDFVGDVVGGVGGIASGVAGAIPGIGPYLGPVVGGITGGPAGFAASLGSNVLQGNYGGGGGGGGGSSTPTYAQPGYNYGNQTYQYGSKPLDMSKYFISGDRGVYNLMPALGQINAGAVPKNMMYNPEQSRASRDIVAANAYTPYEAHLDIQAQMANDPRALAAFNSAYKPTSAMRTVNDENSPMGQFQRRTHNPLGQYVNYGLNDRMPGVEPKLGLRYNQIAKYAAENKNPFFMPYETTQGATSLGFTPSSDKLGAIDTSQYLSGYNTAQTAQQQYNRQQQAKFAANDRRRAEQQDIKAPRPDTTRPIIDPARPGSQPQPMRPQTQPMAPQTQPMAPRMAHGGIAILRRR